MKHRHLKTTKRGNAISDNVDPIKHMRCCFISIKGPEVKLEGEEKQEIFVRVITENESNIQEEINKNMHWQQGEADDDENM